MYPSALFSETRDEFRVAALAEAGFPHDALARQPAKHFHSKGWNVIATMQSWPSTSRSCSSW